MIEYKQAEKRYGKSKDLKNSIKREAMPGLRPLDLTIPAGQIVGILGDNGAGKSTLLQVGAGLLPLTGGSVSIDGRPPSASRGRLAYITGEGSYLPQMTVAQYGAFLEEMTPSFDAAYYAQMLTFFALPSERRIASLSTGQRSRLEVAAGFARRAQYLFLDEPFLGKDLFTRRDFIKVMNASFSGTETVLITTHQVEEVENLIERAVVLHEGRVTGDWMLEDLRGQGKSLADALRTAVNYDPERYKMLLEKTADKKTT